MLSTHRVPAIFADARAVHADALRMLESGDIRDAAEKAWCATKRATDALILPGPESSREISSDTSRGLAELATRDQAFRVLRRRYHARQSTLHGDCFYLGICEPADEVDGRIHRTADYINDAERLAGYSNGA